MKILLALHNECLPDLEEAGFPIINEKQPDGVFKRYILMNSLEDMLKILYCLSQKGYFELSRRDPSLMILRTYPTSKAT